MIIPDVTKLGPLFNSIFFQQKNEIFKKETLEFNGNVMLENPQ